LPSLPGASEGPAGLRRLRLADLPPLRHAPRTRGRFGNRLRFLPLCLPFWILLLASCGSSSPEPRPTGYTYAGPLTLNLRKDLASKSPVIGTAHHGDRLEVIETRRRFVKVRTEEGVVGWTDSNLLLTQQQMDDLRRLSESATKLPSQGTATVYEPVNMHAEPNRQSPSFFRIPEGGSVEVIGHRVAPRIQAGGSASLPVKPTTTKQKAKGKQTGRSAPVLPPPSPPSPPSNWRELSRPRASDLPGNASAPQTVPVMLDDWNLVRTRDGKTGWVLARLLTMAIPDDVAQYAEGHRITAYVSLGDVRDHEIVKHNWLWTTSTTGQQPYEFDSFRVFVWSAKHHHYETAFIERNVKGYYPVEAQVLPGQDANNFSVVLEDKDGKLYRRTYAFSGYHVRMISRTPYQPLPALPEVRPAQNPDTVPVPAPVDPRGWRQTLRNWWKRWFRR